MLCTRPTRRWLSHWELKNVKEQEVNWVIIPIISYGKSPTYKKKAKRNETFIAIKHSIRESLTRVNGRNLKVHKTAVGIMQEATGGHVKSNVY